MGLNAAIKTSQTCHYNLTTNQSGAVKIESLASHVSKQFDISQQDGKIMCY